MIDIIIIVIIRTILAVIQTSFQMLEMTAVLLNFHMWGRPGLPLPPK